uniref:RNA-dependent RNA polymerase n=1 Tax=Suncus murinus associated picornavirus 3 TaxID=3139570 RepID=A0AB38ZKH0_9VIRU
MVHSPECITIGILHLAKVYMVHNSECIKIEKIHLVKVYMTPLKKITMNNFEKKVQEPMRENAPPQMFDLHSSPEFNSTQEVTKFEDEVPKQIVEEKLTEEARISDPLPDQSLIDILQRPRVVSVVPWSKNHAAGQCIARLCFPDEIFKSPVLWSKIQHYVYMQCGLKFSARINGTAYHYGQLLLVWRPVSIGNTLSMKSTSPTSYDNIYSISQYPHMILSPSEKQNVELEIPFLSILDRIPISHFTRNDRDHQLACLGSLELWVLNELHATGFATDPPVSVTVFASLKDIKLSGYTHKTSPFVPLRMFLPQVVGLGRLSQIVSIAQAKKENQGTQAIASYQPLNLASGDIEQPRQSIALEETKISPPFFSSATFSQHLSQYSYLTRSVIRSNMESNTVLLALAVNPALHNLVTHQTWDNKILPTKLSFLSEFFYLWKGPLKYRFDFVASKFHSTRVKIAWYPPQTLSRAQVIDFGDQLSKVVDVQGEVSVEFEVPYLQSQPYLPVSNESNGNNGTIVVTLLNQLTYPTTNIPAIEFNVWVSGPKVKFNAFGCKSDYLLYFPGTAVGQMFDPKKEEMIAQAGDDSSVPDKLECVARKMSKWHEELETVPTVYLTPGVLGKKFDTGWGHYFLQIYSLFERLLLIHLGFRGSVVVSFPIINSDIVVSQYINNSLKYTSSPKGYKTYRDALRGNMFRPLVYFPSNTNSLKQVEIPYMSSLAFRPLTCQELESTEATIVRQNGIEVYDSSNNPFVCVAAGKDLKYIGIGAAPCYKHNDIRP